MNPGGSQSNPDGAADNEGPHCRNCHTGGSSCTSCHGINGGEPGWFFGAAKSGSGGDDYTAYSTARIPLAGTTQAGYVIPDSGTGGAGTGILSGMLTSYMTQQYVHTKAVTGVTAQCVDGGFSWPHRTLGKDLLKDELYGVDFDGTAVGPGEVRGDYSSDNAALISQIDGQLKYTTVPTYASKLTEDSTNTVYINAVGDTSLIASATAQNLDTVCLDCHGGANVWNGDDERYAKTYINAYGEQLGWDLLMKGLP